MGFLQVDTLPYVLFNETLFFSNQSDEELWIITFDTNTETFNKIEGPLVGTKNPYCWNISIENDMVHVYVRFWYKEVIEIWTLNGEMEWTKTKEWSPNPNYKSLTPLQVLKNDEWLMMSVGDVYKVDMSSQEVHRLNMVELDVRGMFVETFVSPSQY